MALNQGSSQRSRSYSTQRYNPWPGDNSLLWSRITIIFHTIVIHDQRVCNDLDPNLVMGQKPPLCMNKTCSQRPNFEHSTLL